MSKRRNHGRGADSLPESELAPTATPVEGSSGVLDAVLDMSSASNSQDASRLISLRVPLPMLEELRRHARRRAMPYQSLLKHWLAERLQEESERLEQHRSAVKQGRAVE